MYLAPDIPGYDEVRDFYRRYALKMGTVMSGALDTQTMAMMQQPAAGKGMADMVAEMSKLKGIPVLQIMRMGTTARVAPRFPPHPGGAASRRAAAADRRPDRQGVDDEQHSFRLGARRRSRMTLHR